ncbi:hypothetical protein [Haladaptatus litoreus]|uniref:hypothetical protein n=1 Tax=Haladaptatus litoreus TaxID=553468 RepID=UPI00111552EB|nr:hypothetical protein [Haladaptatus litoreus]
MKTATAPPLAVAPLATEISQKSRSPHTSSTDSFPRFARLLIPRADNQQAFGRRVLRLANARATWFMSIRKSRIDHAARAGASRRAPRPEARADSARGMSERRRSERIGWGGWWAVAVR